MWKVFSKNWYEHFNQKNLFWKILKFYRNGIQSFSDLRQKVYGKIVRTVFYVFRNMLKKQTFSIFFLFSLCNRTLTKTFLTFGIKFSTKLSKLSSSCSDEHFVEKNSILKTFFSQNLRIFFQSKHYFSTKLTELLFKRWDELFDKKTFFEKLFFIIVWVFERNAFGNKVSQSCQNWILRVQTNTLMKKNNFEIFFSDLEQTFSWILQKKGRKVVKASFYALRRTLWWKNIFLKKFYSFFLSLFENFSDFLQFFSKLTKLLFKCSDRHFGEKYIFFQKRFVKFLSDFGLNNSQLSKQFLRRDCQNRFLHDQETFRGNSLSFFLFSLHFRILVKSSLKFRIEFPEKCWKLHSTFSDEHFDEKRRFWKWVFFRNFSKTFLWVLTKSIRQIVKTVFQVFKRTLWWKLMFLETFFFLLRNRILGSFLTFVIKVSAKLSNLHFTCSDEHFDEKKPFLKYSSSFLWLWPNFFLTFGKKNFKKDCQNRFLHVQTTFRGKRFTDFFFVIGTYSDFEQSFSDNCLKRIRKIDKTAF